MENASKALIIAGAILLAILIISLGIMVYNQAKSTVSDANLDSEAAQTFNAEFTSYVGTISGSKANSLVQAIIANNGTDSNHQITLTDKTGSSEATYKTVGSSTTWPTFENASSYKVTITGYDSTGYISGLTIE